MWTHGREAILAVNRPVAARAEWYLARLAALGAGRLEHLASLLAATVEARSAPEAGSAPSATVPRIALFPELLVVIEICHRFEISGIGDSLHYWGGIMKYELRIKKNEKLTTFKATLQMICKVA